MPLATVVVALYLILGLKFWFRTPIAGIAISLGCLLASWAFMVFGE